MWRISKSSMRVAAQFGVRGRALGRRTALADDQLFRADVERAVLAGCKRSALARSMRRGERPGLPVEFRQQAARSRESQGAASRLACRNRGNSFGHSDPPMSRFKPAAPSTAEIAPRSAAAGCRACPAGKYGLPRRRYFSAPIR